METCVDTQSTNVAGLREQIVYPCYQHYHKTLRSSLRQDVKMTGCLDIRLASPPVGALVLVSMRTRTCVKGVEEARRYVNKNKLRLKLTQYDTRL